MQNNVFEETINPLSSSDIVNTAHIKMLNEMGLPKWLKSLKCPYCGKILEDNEIRSIALRLNPRNVGDVCVEFLCLKCKVGNTLYFEKEVQDMADFCDLLAEDIISPAANPITEEEMYKKKYHNTIQSKYISECSKETINGNS